MTRCQTQASGEIELYFYDELDPSARAAVERHVRSCGECAHALDELRVIRAALSSRPDVSAPRSGDWSRFMVRLDAAIHDPRERSVVRFRRLQPRRLYVAYVAMAALLALVTLSVAVAVRSRSSLATRAGSVAADAPAVTPVQNDRALFAALSDAHFERSKLVVLGLATKDPRDGRSVDWTYERDLASSLLSDTRMYRFAAEDRGLTDIAGVMRDLELVLLQASLTDEKDPSALPQIQRLIQKRDLLEKMDVLASQPGGGLTRTKGI